MSGMPRGRAVEDEEEKAGKRTALLFPSPRQETCFKCRSRRRRNRRRVISLYIDRDRLLYLMTYLASSDNSSEACSQAVDFDGSLFTWRKHFIAVCAHVQSTFDCELHQEEEAAIHSSKLEKPSCFSGKCRLRPRRSRPEFVPEPHAE